MIPYIFLALIVAAIPMSAGAPHTHGPPVHVGAPQRTLSARDWRRAPYSSGVITAHLWRAGLLHPRSSQRRLRLQPRLVCTGKPCTFTPVQASEGGNPVNEDPIAINPRSGKELLTGGNDYNCSSSLQGHYLSPDGGTTWNRSCDALAPGATGGDGDPIVGWDMNNAAYRGGIDSSSPSRSLSPAQRTKAQRGARRSSP